MILLKLFGSVVVAWLISAMGVAALGELIENKNIQDEFILVLLCIWAYMGYHGICGYFKKRLKKKHRVVVISARCLSVKNLRTLRNIRTPEP